MSRMQPNPPTGYPPPHQQGMYYDPHGQPLPPPHQGMPQQSMHSHPHSQAPYDPAQYGYPRDQNGWMDQGGVDGNGYPPGPSRGGGDPYQSYPPQRTSPSGVGGAGGGGGGGVGGGPEHIPRQTQTPLSGSGWSSVRPSAPMPPPPTRPDTRGAVKLEDLVSSDRRQAQHGQAQAGPGGLTSAPLNVSMHDPNRPPGSSHDITPGTGAAQGGGGDGQAGGSGPQQQPGPSEFIKKLYKMLEEESATFGKGRSAKGGEPKRGSVGWGRGGTSFVVWDMNDFTTKVLPQTFRHSNFSSFVRQLNKYGFSKIKHVEEDTGQIKENVWEFQHPNFQAGGKADLESIKRKAVVPKKGPAEGETETSPAGPRGPGGLTGEEAMRLMEMESRVLGLEDRLTRALDEVREARTREMNVVSLLRDIIGHLASAEMESPTSVNNEPSPRIMHLYQMYEQVANPNPSAQYYGVQGAMPLQPNWNVRMTPGVTGYSTRGQFSPMTDGSDSSHRASAENTSPSGFTGARIHPGGASTAPVIRSRNGPGQNGPGQNGPGQNQQVGTGGPLPGSGNDDGDIIEIPKAQQTLYNGEPMGMTPMFAETPSWLTDNTTVQMPIYHRKSSDGLTLRLMVEALSGHGVRFDDETQDPLDPSPGRDRTGFDGSGGAGPSTSEQTVPGGSGMGANGITANTIPEDNNQVNAVASSSSSSSTAPSSGMPSIQQSPFGTLLIPSDSSVRAQVTNAIRLRRSTTVEPHWNKAPKILVVEDDVVYRQLSSKFLEKFGCVTETVENAQGAIEKMNRTKYDLVLMDIFFGPSMDGRKATSLIRQFDMYTPIISMTSNAQPQDVDSYLQSGMNDVLAKPFTKHGLFGILDKHLIHLKAIQLSAEVPRSLGLPPLSDQGIADAVANGAAQWMQSDDVRNPLAAMGWSDETYGIVLQQFLATGMIPDITSIIQTNGNGNGNGHGESSGSSGTHSGGAQIHALPSSHQTQMLQGLGQQQQQQQQHLQQQQQQQQQQHQQQQHPQHQSHQSQHQHQQQRTQQHPQHQPHGGLRHASGQHQQPGSGAIGTNVLFGDNSGFAGAGVAGVGSKRGIGEVDEEWSPATTVGGDEPREVKKVRGGR